MRVSEIMSAPAHTIGAAEPATDSIAVSSRVKNIRLTPKRSTVKWPHDRF
jgi:hypothetical protein